MIDSIHIRNFRSFGDVKAEDCRRINVIVGDNGSGKTALLEALFLVAGVSPEIALRTRSWRGMTLGKMRGTHEDVERELWADLFHQFNTKQPAVISVRGRSEDPRSVTITLNPRGHVIAVPPPRDKPNRPVRVIPDPTAIQFKWKVPPRPDVVVSPKFEDDKLVIPPTPDAYVKGVFFAANQSVTAEIPQRFSDLSRNFKEEEFITKFNRHYPNITKLSNEIFLGTAMLFAKVDGLPQKIPLSLASGGMTKLAAILLGMSDQAGGIILVDEIENGFYHKRLPLVWETLMEFAVAYNCQVFASTHSLECITAAAQVAEKNPQDFSVIRTVLDGDGAKIRQFEGAKFVDAVNEQIEIR